MFKCVNNHITITKGDSASLKVTLKKSDGTLYEMAEGDTLTFSVRKRADTPIMIQIVSNSNIIDFLPTKTKELEPGACVFDIELKTALGDIFTVVGLTSGAIFNMTVLPEVTA